MSEAQRDAERRAHEEMNRETTDDREECPACDGSGRVVVYDPDDPETCERCSGSGRV